MENIDVMLFFPLVEKIKKSKQPKIVMFVIERVSTIRLSGRQEIRA